MRAIRQKEGSLRVHEGGRGTVAHGHAFGLARRSGGEDDPRGVFGAWLVEKRAVSTALVIGRAPRLAQHAEALIGEDTVDVGFAEDHLGALIGVVGVDRHVGRAGGECGQDGQIELALAGGHADADAVSATHAAGVELGGPCGDVGKQLGVGEDLTVVEGRGLGVVLSGGLNDVPQGARGGGLVAEEVVLGDLGHRRGLGLIGAEGVAAPGTRKVFGLCHLSITAFGISGCVRRDDGGGQLAQMLELLVGGFVEGFVLGLRH